MWLLIEVDDSKDVGDNENNRILMEDDIKILPLISNTERFVTGKGIVVHPATP